MYKVYICVGIFLLLSIVKFTAPDYTEEIRSRVIGIIDTDDNYPQMVEALGRKLSREGLGEELIKVFNDFEDRLGKH